MDNIVTTEKELDTVEVLKAIQKAKEVKYKLSNSDKKVRFWCCERCRMRCVQQKLTKRLLQIGSKRNSLHLALKVLCFLCFKVV